MPDATAAEFPEAFHTLHNTAQSMGLPIPIIVDKNTSGPKNATKWKVTIKFKGIEYHGNSGSEKSAKHDAGLKALNDHEDVLATARARNN
ncbi:hypothetical protein CVT24_005072 [Panaeolus cyanescens]|uniref:DRBM domain-containing protein n=1 Tax=Panaeolus cyanescens TaxID=181874 RepID=A0A409VPH4_9AGAR|nr:hypothetical protein CVT24_005072 [Panaeolus cyanescens]